MSKMDNRMDAMILVALMGGKGRNHEVSPIVVKISLTPQGISSGIEADRRIIDDLHAKEWLKETQDKLEPIMKEQTRKFAKFVQGKISS